MNYFRWLYDIDGKLLYQICVKVKGMIDLGDLVKKEMEPDS